MVEKPTSRDVIEGGRGFRSAKEHRWWKKCFKDRPIAVERAFDLDTFSPDEFPQIMAVRARQGWSAYLKQEKISANETVTSEFAASLLPLNAPFRFEAYLRQTRINLTPNVVSTLTGIPLLPANSYYIPYDNTPVSPTPNQLATFLHGAQCAWPLNAQGDYAMFDRGNLQPGNQVLWLLVCNSLMPTQQHQKINLNHARLMEAITHKRKICLPRFFIQRISDAADSASKKDTVPMGVLITKLCESEFVGVLPDDSHVHAQGMFDMKALNRSRGQTKGKEPVEGSSQPTSEPPRQKRKGFEGAIPVDIDALSLKLDEMQVYNQSHFTSMAEDDGRFRERYYADQAAYQVHLGGIHSTLQSLDQRVVHLEGRAQSIEDRVTRIEEVNDGRYEEMRDKMANIHDDVAEGFANIDARILNFQNLMMSRFPPPPNP